MRSLAAALLLLASSAYADTFTAAIDGATVTVMTHEPCALAGVSNLPSRAVWKEGAKSYAGCVGHRSGILIFYFDDRSVVILPSQIFAKTTDL